MDVGTTDALKEWLRDVSIRISGFKNPIPEDVTSLTARDSFTLLLKVFRFLIPKNYELDNEKTTTQTMVEVFVNIFEPLMVSSSLRSRITDVITAAENGIDITLPVNVPGAPTALEAVWGWVASVWFGSGPGASLEELPRETTRERLYTLMYRSALALFSESGKENDVPFPASPKVSPTSYTRQRHRLSTAFGVGEHVSRQSFNDDASNAKPVQELHLLTRRGRHDEIQFVGTPKHSETPKKSDCPKDSGPFKDSESPKCSETRKPANALLFSSTIPISKVPETLELSEKTGSFSLLRAASLNGIEREPFDVERRLREVLQENGEYYTEMVRLHHALDAALQSNEALGRQLREREEAFRCLTLRCNDEKSAELDTAVELFAVQRELEVERSAAARLRDRVAWLQAQFLEQSKQKTEPILSTVVEADGANRLASTKLPCASQDILALETEARLLQSEIDRQRSTILHLKTENERQARELELTQSERDEFKRQAIERARSNADLQHCETELKSQRAIVVAQQHQVEKLTKHIRELEAQQRNNRLDEMDLQNQCDLKLRRPVGETLGRAVEAPLSRRILALTEENKALKEEIGRLRLFDGPQLETANACLKEQCNLLSKRLVDLESITIADKSEKETHETVIEHLRQELNAARATLEQHAEREAAQKVLMEKRMADALEAAEAAEERRKNACDTQTDLLKELNDALEHRRRVETENRALKLELTNLQKAANSHEERLQQLHKDVEQLYAPQIQTLRIALERAEHSCDTLRKELEANQALLHENQEILAKTTAKCAEANKRLTETEAKLTTEETKLRAQSKEVFELRKKLVDSSETLAASEKALKHSQKAAATLQRDISAYKATHTRWKAAQTQWETEKAVNEDSLRKAESEVAFYRAEFEKLATAGLASVVGLNGEATRENLLSETLQMVTRELDAAKAELKKLHLDITERMRVLPVVSGDHNEFEMVDVVQYFEREKARADTEIRSLTIRLSDAETAYQNLLREYHALGKSHSKTLRDVIDLKRALSTAEGRQKAGSPETVAAQLQIAQPIVQPASFQEAQPSPRLLSQKLRSSSVTIHASNREPHQVPHLTFTSTPPNDGTPTTDRTASTEGTPLIQAKIEEPLKATSPPPETVQHDANAAQHDSSAPPPAPSSQGSPCHQDREREVRSGSLNTAWPNDPDEETVLRSMQDSFRAMRKSLETMQESFHSRRTRVPSIERLEPRQTFNGSLQSMSTRQNANNNEFPEGASDPRRSSSTLLPRVRTFSGPLSTKKTTVASDPVPQAETRLKAAVSESGHFTAARLSDHQATSDTTSCLPIANAAPLSETIQKSPAPFLPVQASPPDRSVQCVTPESSASSSGTKKLPPAVIRAASLNSMAFLPHREVCGPKVTQIVPFRVSACETAVKDVSGVHPGESPPPTAVVSKVLEKSVPADIAGLGPASIREPRAPTTSAFRGSTRLRAFKKNDNFQCNFF